MTRRFVLISHYLIVLIFMAAPTAALSAMNNHDVASSSLAIPRTSSALHVEQRQQENVVEKTVIVVGAGLAGLAVSLGLQRAGFLVRLVEKRPNFSRQGATFGLKPNGIKALDEIDPEIMPSLHKIGIEIPGQGYMLPWFAMRDALLNQVRNYPDRIQLDLGMDLKEIANDPDSVKATFWNEQGNKQVQMEACLLVGCDGINSAVRDLLGLSPSVFCGTKYWRGSLRVPASSKRLVALLTRDDTQTGMGVKYGQSRLALFNFHSVIPNTLGWSLVTKDSSIVDGSHPWTAFRNVKDDGIMDDDTREMLDELFAATNPDDLTHVWDLRTIDPSLGWGGTGRVILLGDAAHAIRPVSGVGGSLAFEDAVVLCRELAECSSSTISDCIDRTIHKRQPRVTKVWQAEWDLAERMYKEENPTRLSQEYMEWLHEGV